mmetsp:Transcript_39708/g.104741  ORF Transcript_39708/g.104741 Transcript_39708/m.104741 type:complete len:241 (-) Transcript_39708:909-1631(-)
MLHVVRPFSSLSSSSSCWPSLSSMSPSSSCRLQVRSASFSNASSAAATLAWSSTMLARNCAILASNSRQCASSASTLASTSAITEASMEEEPSGLCDTLVSSSSALGVCWPMPQPPLAMATWDAGSGREPRRWAWEPVPPTDTSTLPPQSGATRAADLVMLLRRFGGPSGAMLVKGTDSPNKDPLGGPPAMVLRRAGALMPGLALIKPCISAVSSACSSCTRAPNRQSSSSSSLPEISSS